LTGAAALHAYTSTSRKADFVESYIKPDNVVSPKAHWRHFSTILDRGEGDCAYALGMWDGEPRVAFRWNGDSETGPLGNPQSRGLPIWIMLDPALHEAVLALVPAGKRAIARNFLGLTSAEELQEINAAARIFHLDRVTKITNGEAPCTIMEGAHLILHVAPFSAFGSASHQPLPNLFKVPEKYPPVSMGSRPSLGLGSVRIGFDGLLIGSNDSGLGEAQRAYVTVSQSGMVESVVKISVGQKNQFIELDKLLQIVVRYTRIYAAAISSGGADLPCVVLASLQNVKGARLLHDLITHGTIPEDIPYGSLDAPVLTFSPAILETVPGTEGESATALLPILSHMSHAAGLPAAPCFDPSGNYLWRDAAVER